MLRARATAALEGEGVGLHKGYSTGRGGGGVLGEAPDGLGGTRRQPWQAAPLALLPLCTERAWWAGAVGGPPAWRRALPPSSPRALPGRAASQATDAVKEWRFAFAIVGPPRTRPPPRAVEGWRVAAAAAVAAAVHVGGHAVHLAAGGDGPPGGTGAMVLVSGGVLVALLVGLRMVTLRWVRVHRREVFAVGHGVLAAAAVAALAVHGMHRGAPSSVKWLAPAAAVYGLDLLARRWRTHTVVVAVGADAATDAVADAAADAAPTAAPHPPTTSRLYGNVLCLAVPRPFPFVAGQAVLLRVPALSRHQWHPFTIASAPADPMLRLYVKAAGDWTGALLDLWRSTAAAAAAAAGSGGDGGGGAGGSLIVQLQGPYGAPSQYATAYDRLVLVGAGIGATPFVSVGAAIFGAHGGEGGRGRRRALPGRRVGRHRRRHHRFQRDHRGRRG